MARASERSRLPRKALLRRLQPKSKRKATGSRFLEGLDSFVRHPLTLLILGFVLTAFVGASIQNRQQEIEKNRADIVSANAALERLSQTLLDSVIRSQFVVDAIARRGTSWSDVDRDSDSATRLDEAMRSASAELLADRATILAPFQTLQASSEPADSLTELHRYMVSNGELIAHLPIRGPVQSVLLKVFLDEFAQCISSYLDPIRESLAAPVSVRLSTFRSARSVANREMVNLWEKRWAPVWALRPYHRDDIEAISPIVCPADRDVFVKTLGSAIAD